MDSNMGNMTREEVVEFFDAVTADLGVDIALEFTPTAPSIYLTGGQLENQPKILFCTNDLEGDKWQVKERVLHEIAHHYEEGKRCHGPNFYGPYAQLVARYLGKIELSLPGVTLSPPDDTSQEG